MKRTQKIITWIIAAIFVAVLVWYAMALFLGASDDNAPAPVRGLLITIGVALVPVMIMMIVTAVRRNREIEEEDDDDLGQY